MTEQPNHFYDEPPDGENEDINKVREAAQFIIETVPFLMEHYKKLKRSTTLSDSEKQILLEIEDALRNAMPYIDYVKDYLGENLYQESVAYYYHLKELASQGNADAQKIIDNLKPSFEEALKEQLGDSHN